MNESDIPIKKRQMTVRKSQMDDSDTKEISNNNIRSTVPFDKGRHHESKDDTFGDEREYMELCHSRKKRIKMYKRSNRNKENYIDRCRSNIVWDKLLQSNWKSNTSSDSCNEEENVAFKLKEKGNHRKMFLGKGNCRVVAKLRK